MAAFRTAARLFPGWVIHFLYFCWRSKMIVDVNLLFMVLARKKSSSFMYWFLAHLSSLELCLNFVLLSFSCFWQFYFEDTCGSPFLKLWLGLIILAISQWTFWDWCLLSILGYKVLWCLLLWHNQTCSQNFI
jgi:hypothetical protein